MLLFKKPFNQKSTALILTICIIASIITPSLLYPQQAKSYQLVKDVIHIILQTIWEALKIVWRAAMEYLESIQAAIAAWTQGKTILTWLVGVALNILLHQILSQLTNDIVNWIQNGTTPRFLTMGLDDWLGMAVDNALGNFIDQYLGIGWLCEPFDIDIKIALLKQPTFKEEARCSISDIVGNIEDFYNNFSVGGWGGWIKLTEGGNNVYSTYLIAMEEIQKIQTIEEKEQEAEIARGSGFFSPKDCVWYDGNNKPIDLVVESSGKRYTTGYDDVWGTASLPAKCAPSANILAEPFETDGLHKDGSSVVGPCYKKCISHTPGKQISDSVSKTVNRFWDTINAQIGAATAKAGPLSIYVQAILTALVNRVLTEGYGLLFAKNEGIPGYGDLGGGGDMPEIFDPTEIGQDKIAIGLLEIKFPFFKTSLDELLIEQTTNWDILDSILKKYEAADLVLDKILDPVNNCDSSTKAWATTQKGIVAGEITKVRGEITAIGIKIAGTKSAIGRVSVIIADIEEYYKKYDAWKKVYDTSGGTYNPADSNDPVTKALIELDEVKEELIEQLQGLLTDINGSYTGDTIPTLTQEISDTYVDVSNVIIPRLKAERGDQDSPAVGTLYARLETAKALKLLADEELASCGVNAFYKQIITYTYAVNY